MGGQEALDDQAGLIPAQEFDLGLVADPEKPGLKKTAAGSTLAGCAATRTATLALATLAAHARLGWLGESG
jgi:hypothetical protein